MNFSIRDGRARHEAALLAALILSAAAGPTRAADTGTSEERKACIPDVLKHCGDVIPDVDRIIACLREKLRDLIAACRVVVAGPDPSDPRGFSDHR